MPSCWTDERTFGRVLETGLADGAQQLLPQLEITEARTVDGRRLRLLRLSRLCRRRLCLAALALLALLTGLFV